MDAARNVANYNFLAFRFRFQLRGTCDEQVGQRGDDRKAWEPTRFDTIKKTKTFNYKFRTAICTASILSIGKEKYAACNWNGTTAQ